MIIIPILQTRRTEAHRDVLQLPKVLGPVKGGAKIQILALELAFLYIKQFSSENTALQGHVTRGSPHSRLHFAVSPFKLCIVYCRYDNSILRRGC